MTTPIGSSKPTPPKLEQSHKMTVGSEEYTITHLQGSQATKATEAIWTDTSAYIEHLEEYLITQGTSFKKLLKDLPTATIYITPRGITDGSKVLVPWAPDSSESLRIQELVEQARLSSKSDAVRGSTPTLAAKHTGTIASMPSFTPTGKYGEERRSISGAVDRTPAAVSSSAGSAERKADEEEGYKKLSAMDKLRFDWLQAQADLTADQSRELLRLLERMHGSED